MIRHRRLPTGGRPRFRPLPLWGLLTLLSLSPALWLAEAGFRSAPAPAQTAPLGVLLVSEPGEPYSRLIRRAEEAARAIANQTFNGSGNNRINITVMGSNRGQIAPLLTLSADRAQWQLYGSSGQLFTYYQTARSLLQLEGLPSGPADLSPTASGTTSIPSTPTPAPPTVTPASPTGTPGEEAIAPERPDVTIDIPAAPAGQVGLPRSVLR